MTYKRFTYIAFDGFEDNGEYITPYQVVDLLNELHEENQALKQSDNLTELEEENQELRKDVIYWRHKALNEEPANCKCRVDFQ